MQPGKAQVVADTAIKLLSELGFTLEKLRGQVSSETLLRLIIDPSSFLKDEID